MKVVVHRRAARYLQRLPPQEKQRIQAALRELASDPLKHPAVKAMLGAWAGYHRLRVGGTRIIFQVVTEKATVYVDHIGPRGDVYK
jgi:mRNA interferase RelE/StbE